jgi:hypothetical protein
MVGLTEEGSF